MAQMKTANVQAAAQNDRNFLLCFCFTLFLHFQFLANIQYANQALDWKTFNEIPNFSDSFIADTAVAPLKTLISGDGASRSRRERGQSSTGAPSSGHSSHYQSSSSSDRSSSGDVKAAVENIQAMFAAYLENQRHSSSSDDSNS